MAEGKVDVPTPMHIGPLRNGQGDCHIKGGYVDDTSTFTVKMATVSTRGVTLHATDGFPTDF